VISLLKILTVYFATSVKPVRGYCSLKSGVLPFSADAGHPNSTVTLQPVKDTSYLEILFYTLAGFVLFALLTTFIPLSVLYKKAKASMPDKTDDDYIYKRGSITWASPRDELDGDSSLST
jgi:hypothetical protein